MTKVNVDYNDPSSLSSALNGMDVLIITMAVTAPPDTQAKLIHAAANAKVPWVFPNEWGLDHTDDSLAKDTLIGRGHHQDPPACRITRRQQLGRYRLRLLV